MAAHLPALPGQIPTELLDLLFILFYRNLVYVGFILSWTLRIRF
jgi:hypothetical protein